MAKKIVAQAFAEADAGASAGGEMWTSYGDKLMA